MDGAEALVDELRWFKPERGSNVGGECNRLATNVLNDSPGSLKL